MRDEEHRALEADERLLEDLGGGDVEVVGRLVEEEQVARLEQELREREAARSPPEKPLTTRSGSSPQKRKRARYCRAASTVKSPRMRRTSSTAVCCGSTSPRC